MKQVVKFLICILVFLNQYKICYSQLFGGQIIANSCYPAGTVFCASGPNQIVEITNPLTGATWMDRNLGATQVATSPTDAAAYGDLYQWGRRSDGHQCRNSANTNVISSVDQPLHGDFILAPNNPKDWRSPQNNSLWQGINGINNPCPCDFRLPTGAELTAEYQSWASNNASGAFGSVLKFTRNGYRSGVNGTLINTGAGGDYFSSTISGINVLYLAYDGSVAYVGTSERSFGRAVRCIKD